MIFPYHDQLIVKRIVGLPGEEVEVREGVLYVNGDPMVEDYGTKKGGLDVGRGKLLAVAFATLGDNRTSPLFQTVHPIVRESQILGKVVYVLRLLPQGV